VLIKSYEEVMNKTPQERMLEAQRAANVVKEPTLEGEKCQKKIKTKAKAKKK
jgi:hypothetical protein